MSVKSRNLEDKNSKYLRDFHKRLYVNRKKKKIIHVINISFNLKNSIKCRISKNNSSHSRNIFSKLLSRKKFMRVDTT